MFDCRVYPIIDISGSAARSPVELARACMAAGVRLVQLRMKGVSTREFVAAALAVKTVTDAAGAKLIVNDRVDIAVLVNAAGVHLGQEDLPVAAAREQLGVRKIVGFSTHSSAQARAAAAEGVADYLGFGPIFPTTSKANPDPVVGVEGLREVRSLVRLPLVAIGGITAATLREALSAGADAVAMIGEIVRASDPESQVRHLLELARQAT